ncbi:BURP domain-containing protein BNM2A-like [Cornus florida]|uniref:BURP domain-containing protein BNM2A-like n=1 Tax=Cornus florida TaxID=4283 RepID=UPI00289D7C85|nr:BURP domain-containing protein BNM2A-like [Cornus florida]
MDDDGIAEGTNALRLHGMDGDHDKDGDHVHKASQQHAMEDHVQVHDHKHNGDVHGHPSSHMDHMDPSLIVFFILDDLKVGKIMPIFFPNKDLSSSPHFLPKEEADSIPFSLQELPELLQLFSFSRGSPQAKAMEDTLRQCEIEPMKGEVKHCATSLESMLDFTRAIFGLESQFKVLSTTHLTKTNSNTLVQNYTVLEVPREFSAPKMVACHTMPYSYAVFYCHSQVSESRVFQVSLGGENGDKVEAVAVCHLDTSQWSRNHVSFRVLGIEPGTSPVCHFFPWDNLVWVPLPTSIVQSS